MKKKVLMMFACLMMATLAFEYAIAQFISTDIIQGARDGIRYATGGISVEERMAMNKMNENYNLRLMFALKSGHYLSDIQVDIRNIDGDRLLLKESNGPLFLVSLPAGRYSITTTHKNHTIVKTVPVSMDFQTVMFHWDNHQW